jgi:hypothetical protein
LRAGLGNCIDIYYVMAVCAMGSAVVAKPDLLRRRIAATGPAADAAAEAGSAVGPADPGEGGPAR